MIPTPRLLPPPRISLTLGLTLVFSGALAILSHPASAQTLVFGDEFNGNDFDRLDGNKWNVFDHVDYLSNPAQVYFSPEEVYLYNYGGVGYAAFQCEANSSRGTAYQCGEVTSKFSYHYGWTETRVAMPWVQGYWPGVWQVGTNCDNYPNPNCHWPMPGSEEIDIVEYQSQNPNRTFMTQHFGDCDGNSNRSCDQYVSNDGPSVNYAGEYHNFAINWWEGGLQWYVDGQQVRDGNGNPVTLNRAVSSSDETIYMMNSTNSFIPGPNPSDGPSWMVVDYLRVYQ